MRKAVAVPAVALLFLTGCSSAAAGSGAPPASGPGAAAPSAAPPQPASEEEASEEEACSRLLETNGEGPLYQAIYVLKSGDGTSGFGASAATARTLDTELDGIAAAAPQDMEAALAELSSPMESTIQRAADPTSPWDVNIESWKGAVAELLTRCAPYETATAGADLTARPPAETAATAGAAYPGYPVTVEALSLDYRVAAWFGDRLVDGRAVALAPGLYTAYDPAVPDLQSYYVPENAAGDGTMKQIVFPASGKSATWAGVSPGPQEPQR